MKLPIYQVDAFASEVFRGNPAAVVPCTEPLSSGWKIRIVNKNAIFVEEKRFAESAVFDNSENGPVGTRLTVHDNTAQVLVALSLIPIRDCTAWSRQGVGDHG